MSQMQLRLDPSFRMISKVSSGERFLAGELFCSTGPNWVLPLLPAVDGLFLATDAFSVAVLAAGEDVDEQFTRGRLELGAPSVDSALVTSSNLRFGVLSLSRLTVQD